MAAKTERHWSGPGRKSELEDPVMVSYYIESKQRDKLAKIAKAMDVRGPSAAMRKLIDDYKL